jgi:hypothetical protein
MYQTQAYSDLSDAQLLAMIQQASDSGNQHLANMLASVLNKRTPQTQLYQPQVFQPTQQTYVYREPVRTISIGKTILQKKLTVLFVLVTYLAIANVIEPGSRKYRFDLGLGRMFSVEAQNDD